MLAGAVVFLVFVIVETIVAFVLPSNGSSEETNFHNAMNCVKCFLNDYNACDKVGIVGNTNHDDGKIKHGYTGAQE